MSRSLVQWIDYIQTLHARTIDLGLDRVAKVWEQLKPDKLPTVITVAGTNGKGSSVSMLESVYRHAGYQTGAFTSPHLVVFNERIRVNNCNVSDAILLASFEKVESIRGGVSLTFFEFNTLLALDIFCQHELDVIILEVGLGGRLDATNIITNDLALITAIGLDHTAWLGNDRETIAIEKAGIIKEGAFAVIADPQAPDNLPKVAIERSAVYVQPNQHYQVNTQDKNIIEYHALDQRLNCFDGHKFEAILEHVKYNTAGVISSVALLKDKLPVSQPQLKMGLSDQFLPARLQLVEGTPSILLDVSHNEQSIMALLEYMSTLTITGDVHAVFAALEDKHYDEAYIALKRTVDYWHLATLEGERGQTAKDLKRQLFAKDDETHTVYLFDTPIQAYNSAIESANATDLIVIFGSFHLVGAIIPRLNL